jgi:gamma-tubulin complex component 3
MTLTAAATTTTDPPPYASQEVNSTTFRNELAQKEAVILRQALLALQGIVAGPDDDGEGSNDDQNPQQQRQQQKQQQPQSWLWETPKQEWHIPRLVVPQQSLPQIDTLPPEAWQYSKLGYGAAEVIQVLGQAGWLYTRIQAYLTAVQQQAQSNNQTGAIQRGLTTVLQQEMKSYRSFVVDLERKTLPVLHQDAATATSEHTSDTLHLRDLLVAIQGPMRRLRCLAGLTDGLTPTLQGGPLLRALESHCHHGDSQHVDVVLSLLQASATPWMDMLWDWITQGLLPARPEFFVQQRPNVPDRNLWRQRYHIDTDQLPPAQILPPDMITKAFQAGKGIKFIRHCLSDGEYTLGNLEEEARTAFVYKPSAVAGGTNEAVNDFCDCLDRAADKVNQHILQSLRNDHILRWHLYCLKQFLLLGQGDFVANLTEALHNEFGHHGGGIVGIYRHTLTALKETALRSSNAIHLPEECLQRLQVELRLSPDDAVNFKFGPDKETENDTRTVWDIFQLDYTLPDPVLAIIEPAIMEEYRTLFVHLFGLRKIEYFLNFTWRQSAMLSHALQSMAQYSAIKASTDPYYARAVVLLRRISITRQTMINFLVNLKSYLMLEVIEGGWERLERRIKDSNSLDALIEAHENYVKAIRRQSLFCDSDKENAISVAINKLLQLCNRFSLYQRNLFGHALELADKAAVKRRLAAQRAKEGNWGFDEVENTQTEETTFFGLSDESKLRDLDVLSRSFHETFLTLLQALDDKLHGPTPPSPDGLFATPPPLQQAQERKATVDEYMLDEDLKLLRFLRSQLDQNQFYQKDL